MKSISVHFPEALLDALEELVQRRLYSNRCEAIRVAVRDLVLREYGRREE